MSSAAAAPPQAQEEETRPAVRALKRLLDAPLKACALSHTLALSASACVARGADKSCAQVELSDGRVLYGQLQCADRQGNLVLHSTREVLPKRSGAAAARGGVPTRASPKPRGRCAPLPAAAARSARWASCWCRAATAQRCTRARRTPQTWRPCR